MDLNTCAFNTVLLATAENKWNKRKDAARIGGKSGGPARAIALSPEKRRESATKANRARRNKTA